jgi:hypothetical protein
VEKRYGSAMARQVFKKHRYNLVAFTGTCLGSASNGDGSPSESILEALESGDSEYGDKGYDSNEYDAAMKAYEAELALEELQEKEQATTMQVFVTNKGDDREPAVADPLEVEATYAQATGAQDVLPPAATTIASELPKIHGGPRLAQLPIPTEHHPEDFTTPADKIVYLSRLDHP